MREQPKCSKSGNPDGDGGDDSLLEEHNNGSKQNKDDNQETNDNQEKDQERDGGDDPSNGSLDINVDNLPTLHNTQNFEKNMKEEVSLQQLTRPNVYLFYNKLCHLSSKYGILLKPLCQLQPHSPIYPESPFMKVEFLKKNECGVIS